MSAQFNGGRPFPMPTSFTNCKRCGAVLLMFGCNNPKCSNYHETQSDKYFGMEPEPAKAGPIFGPASRFGRQVKREGLAFQYGLFDTIHLASGAIGIITGFGIYDEQYWCEVCYGDGVRLEGANYYNGDEGAGICCLSERQRALQMCIDEYTSFAAKFRLDWSAEIAALQQAHASAKE